MNSETYWSSVVDLGGEHIAYPLWRNYCDVLHTRLLHRWLGDARFSTALKTDLFDESCGTGMAPELQLMARKVVGIDVSKSIAARAVERHPLIEVRVGDVRHLPFDCGTFDFIFSNSTLDHFEDPDDVEKSVMELVRVLTPGGMLLLTLDNPLNPVVWLRNKIPTSFMGRTSLAPYFVGHTLSVAPMVRLLQSCGCEVHRQGYIMHLPRIVFLHACRYFDPEKATGRILLRFMLGFEALACLPTAPFTGHFAAALGVKRS